MKNLMRIIKFISCLLVVYSALYLGTIILSHTQYNFYPSYENILRLTTHEKGILLGLSLALIGSSLMQFVSLCAIKKKVNDLIFLLPAIIAGVLFTFSTL